MTTNLSDDFIDDEAAFEEAASNPALAEAAQRAIAGGDDAVPSLPDPLDGPVTLPGGFRRLKPGGLSFEDVTKAWVTELNGEAEERIAKARLKNDAEAFLEAVLISGVEKLGDETPTTADLRSLLVGDRDFLLLEISRATYGDDLEFEDFTCYHCGKEVSFTVHKGEDIPVRRLESQDDIEFEVKLRNDRVAVVRLPTGSEQIAGSKTETVAESNTVMLAACISEIRGPKGTVHVAGDQDVVRRLGVADRQKIVRAVFDRMPGPQYNEIRFTHPECGNEIRLTVTLSDLFRGM